MPTTAMPATSTVVVLKALPPPDRDVEAVVVLRTSHRTNSWVSLQQDRLEHEQMHGAVVPASGKRDRKRTVTGMNVVERRRGREGGREGGTPLDIVQALTTGSWA